MAVPWQCVGVNGMKVGGRMSDCWPGEGGLQDGAAGEGTAANTSQVRSYHIISLNLLT